jgi:hypothetical protein
MLGLRAAARSRPAMVFIRLFVQQSCFGRCTLRSLLLSKNLNGPVSLPVLLRASGPPASSILVKWLIVWLYEVLRIADAVSACELSSPS